MTSLAVVMQVAPQQGPLVVAPTSAGMDPDPAVVAAAGTALVAVATVAEVVAAAPIHRCKTLAVVGLGAPQRLRPRATRQPTLRLVMGVRPPT